MCGQSSRLNPDETPAFHEMEDGDVVRRRDAPWGCGEEGHRRGTGGAALWHRPLGSGRDGLHATSPAAAPASGRPQIDAMIHQMEGGC